MWMSWPKWWVWPWARDCTCKWSRSIRPITAKSPAKGIWKSPVCPLLAVLFSIGRFCPTAYLKYPQLICPGEDVRHYKTQIAPRPCREDGGGIKCKGVGSIDPAILWCQISIGPALAVHSNSGARSDRTSLWVINNIVIYRYPATVQCKNSHLWGGHWLNPQIATKSCIKRKIQSFWSFFNSWFFNFSCNTLLNNWLKNWGNFVSHWKKSLV
jgi:hypothetical protein